jgi:acetolactate synthase-1/2/3 large subunit
MSEMMTGAEMVIRALQDQGVDTLFGYPGGAVLPIYDALFHQEKVRHILVRHEQAPCMRRGLCPLLRQGRRGARDLRPRRHERGDGPHRRHDGFVPLVCITGQVPTHLIGSDAFQECDTVGITRHCTKHNYLVKSIEDLPRILHEAFYVAANGRPGPVVVDLPKDIQFKSGLYARPTNNQHKTYRPVVKGDIEKIKAAIALMASAQAPGVLHGRRRHQCGSARRRALRELVQSRGFPITST